MHCIRKNQSSSRTYPRRLISSSLTLRDYINIPHELTAAHTSSSACLVTPISPLTACCNRRRKSLPSTSSTPLDTRELLRFRRESAVRHNDGTRTLNTRDFHCDPGTSLTEPRVSERPRDTPCSSSASPNRTRDPSTSRCGTRRCRRSMIHLPWRPAATVARIALAEMWSE